VLEGEGQREGRRQERELEVKGAGGGVLGAVYSQGGISSVKKMGRTTGRESAEDWGGSTPMGKVRNPVCHRAGVGGD